jgi:hypothetical protein
VLDGRWIAREFHSICQPGADLTARQFSTTERQFNPSMGEETAPIVENGKNLDSNDAKIIHLKKCIPPLQ